MNKSLGWKIFGLFVSIFLIIGGLSGELVLRGTESSTALVVVGFLYLIWDIYAIATHKNQKTETEENTEEGTEPLPDIAQQETDIPQNHDQLDHSEENVTPPSVSEHVPATAPVDESQPAHGKSTVFAGSMQSYYLLEHKVETQLHKVGDIQKISSERAEIGRDPNCEVRFDEQFETVSRRHAAIVKEENHWKLTPVSQTNPTFINGRRVHKEWYLQHGDEIQCALNGPVLVFKM